RNSAARARPQRRQRQRRVAWSTFRLSSVSKWPLPQKSGMAMDSRTRSGEKHTTSVLVASKHAPATTLQKNNIEFSELRHTLPWRLATNRPCASTMRQYERYALVARPPRAIEVSKCDTRAVCHIID